MTAGTVTPYRSGQQAGRDGFGRLLHAEWTKFRTVRGWLTGMVAAALLMAALGLVTSSGRVCGVGPFPGHPYASPCTALLGPDGKPVTDSFYFVHRPLAGDGSITARVTSLTGVIMPAPGVRQPHGLQPWSKGGIIIKAGTRPGSAYAALMVTGSHGVRMQYDYTGDTAGPAGGVSAASPRWLRLTRSGAAVTGYASADGAHWTRVGTATLPGLPPAAQAGLFATSPGSRRLSAGLGSGSVTGHRVLATAVFDHVSLRGGSGGGWQGTAVGAGGRPLLGSPGGFRQASGGFTVSGTGDIAPVGDATPVETTLGGTFAGLIAVVVVGTMFVTAEYRRGLIRTTFAASPRRGRVLAAKAIVIGSVTFLAGLAGAAISVPFGERILRGNGNFMYPAGLLTDLRVIAGTAALLAVAAVLALAVGAVLRRSAAAVTAVIVAVVLPYILATSYLLPAGPSQWLTRLTPAAAFAIQQSIPAYPQVAASYTPSAGYFPLAPWAGLAVLCGYAALALGLAVFLLRRRDA